MTIQIYNHIRSFAPTALQLAALWYAKDIYRELRWFGGERLNAAIDQGSRLVNKIFTKQTRIGSPSALGLAKFIERNPLSVSDRTFQHVLGEWFGEKSYLEGNYPVTMTGHFLALLRERIETMKSSPDCATPNQDVFCRDYLFQTGESALSHFEALSRQFETAVFLRRAFDSAPQRLYDAIVAETEKLQSGESFFFQGGWSSKVVGGHALVYEVTKEKEGSYSFRVYNGGEGLQYHAQIDEGGKKQVLRFTEIGEIGKENLLRPLFWQAIYELGQPPPYGEATWKASELYEMVLPLLEGKMSHKAFDPGQTQPISSIGHCTYLSWAGLLHEHLGKKGGYNRIEFEFQFKTLRDYFLQNQDRLADEGVWRGLTLALLQFGRGAGRGIANSAIEENFDILLSFEEEGQRRLLQKGLSLFARRAKELFEAGEISEEEAAYTAKWLQEIDKVATAGEEKRLAEIGVNGSLSEALQERPRAVFSVIHNHGIRVFEPKNTSLRSIWGLLEPPPYCALTFHQDIQAFAAAVREANQANRHLEVMTSIQEFVKAIPIDWMEKPHREEKFWSRLSKEEAEKTLSTLTLLSKEYLFSILKDASLAVELTASDYLTQIKLLALGDALSRETLDTEIPRLYQAAFDLVLERSASAVSLFDPRWALQVEPLRAYFQRIDPGRIPGRSFFSAEKREFKPFLAGVPKEEQCSLHLCISIHNYEMREDLLWIQNRLQDPASLQKVRSHFPGVNEKGSLDQALFFAFPESEGQSEAARQILGAPFYELRELSLLSHALLHTREPQDLDRPLASPSAEFGKGIDQRIHFFPEDPTIETDDFWVEEESIFGIEKPWNADSPSRLFDAGDSLPFHRFTRTDLSGIAADQIDPLAADVEQLYENRDESFLRKYPSNRLPRNRLSPHDRLQPGQRVRSIKALNGQDEKELLALSSATSLQIQETFGYFRRRSELLTLPVYQNLFKKLMFEPGLLMQEFRNSPPGRFADQLAEFCKEHYLQNSRLGNLSMALYFLELGHQFQSHVEAALLAFPDAFPKDYRAPFLDVETEYERLLVRADLKEEDRIDLLLNRGLGYGLKERLKSTEAKRLLIAAAYGLALQPDPPRMTWEKHEIELPNEKARKIKTLRRLLSRFRADIRSMVEKEGTEPVCNEILQTVLPGSENRSWSVSSYPRFESKDGAFALDLLEGTLFQRGGALRKFPLAIRESPLVSSLLEPQEMIFGIEQEEGVWQFSNKKGEEYRLLSKQGLICRKIGESWAMRVAPPIRLPLALQRGRSFWQEGKETVWIAGPAGIEARIDLVLSPPSSTQQYPPRHLASVHKIEKGKETGFALENLFEGGHSFGPLESFAGKEELLIWNKGDGSAPPKVEIPKYGLRFQGDKKGGKSVLVCKELKGYRVSESQTVPPLGRIEQYLVLEENGKEKTILIPNGRLALVSGGSLSPRFSMVKRERGPDFFRYKWNQKGLLANTVEGKLQLAYLHLAHQNYDAAHALLKTLSSYLRPYSAGETALLTEIVEGRHDFDPRAIAVRSLAAYHLKRSQTDSFQKGAELTDDFASYLQKKDKVPLSLRLTREEEKLLFPSSSAASLSEKIRLRQSFLKSEIGSKDLKERYNLHGLLHTSFFESDEPLLNRLDVKGGILRQRAIAKNFFKLYALFKKPSGKDRAKEALSLLSPRRVECSLSLDGMEKEIRSLLLLALTGESETEQKIAAAVLLGVLEAPDPFPSIEDLHEHRQRIVSGSKSQYESCNWLEKTIIDPVKKGLQAWMETQLVDPFSSRQEEEVFWPKRIDGPASVESSLQSSYSTKIPKAIWAEEPISKLGDYLEEIAPAPEYEARFKSANGMLFDLFSFRSNDPVAKGKFETLKAEVGKYRTVPLPSRFQIRSGADLKGLEKRLTQEAACLRGRLEARELEIVSLLNVPPSKGRNRLIDSFDRVSGEKKEKPVSEAILAFYSGGAGAIQKLNSELSQKEAFELIRMTGAFLQEATRLQHISRILQSLQAVLSSLGKEEEHEAALKQFAAEATAKRSYDIEQHPEYLVFEYANDLLMRPSQIESLEKLKARGKSDFSPHDLGTALEMIMGAGKTSVLLPLTALLDADGRQIPFVVIPASLLPSMSEELNLRFGDSFQRRIDVISIDRSTQLDASRLERLLDRIESARTEKKAIVMTSESLQSFFLKCVEAFDRRAEEIALYRKILHAMRSSGEGTLDEMDFILDILKSHHFDSGEKRPLPTEALSTVSDLYLLLVESPKLASRLNVSFLPSKQGKPFTPAYYQEEIRPLLIEEILKGGFSKTDPDLKGFFQTLHPKEKGWVAAYFSEKPDAAAFSFVDKLPSMKVKNSLSILKEQLSELLPLTMKKQVDEHYGPVPEGAAVSQSTWLSIPYHGSNNPALNSQFGTSLEIMNYTLQQYLAKGIPMKMLEEEIQTLKKEAIAFLKKYPKKDVETTAAYREFFRLAGPLAFDLFTLTPSQMEALRERINQTPHLLVDLVKRFALQEIREPSQQLNTNAQIFSALFKRLKGFTGTMWNSETFPRAFSELSFSDTDVKTLHLLMQKGMNASPQIIEGSLNQRSDLPKALKTLFGKAPLGSIADAGGVFRNFDNGKVAQELLKIQEKEGYQGVIFYDEKNQLMIWEAGKEAPIPLSSSDLPFYKRAAYWDQKHTTGSDLKLASHMHAAVTVSRHTMMRDLLQTVWRLRGFENGQTVSFALCKEDQEVIDSTLARSGMNASNKLGKLFLYFLYNQSQRQGMDNARALKQKWQNILIDPILEVFSDPEVSDRDARDIFHLTRDLFISSTTQDFYRSIGGVKVAQGSGKVVRKNRDAFLSSPPFQAFRSHPLLRSRFDIEKMEKQVRLLALEELPRLPETLPLIDRYEREVEIETEKEMEREAETQVETETEKEQEKAISRDYYDSLPSLQWDKAKLFEKDTYSTHKVTETIEFPLSKAFEDRKLQALLSIQDLLQTYRETSGLLSFDPDLLTTLNLCPTYMTERKEDELLWPPDTDPMTRYRYIPQPDSAPYQPFGQYQDPTIQLLVIQNKASGNIQVAMIDLEDVGQIETLLNQDRTAPLSGKREVRLALYHLENGLYRQGSDPIDEKALEDNPKFLRLKAQAKFFNGASSYAEAEWLVLKTWIESQDKKKAAALFKEKILAWKPTSRKSFLKSEFHAFLFPKAAPSA